MRPPRQPRSQRVALLAAALAALAVPCAAATLRITNIAHGKWSADGVQRQADSNAVVLEVERAAPAPASAAASLTIFRDDRGGDAVSYRPSTCGATGTAAVAVPTAATATRSRSLTATTAIRAGEELVFAIDAPAANRDPARIETIAVTLTTRHGDEEAIAVFETGADTGRFVGSIRTRATPPARVVGDCALSLGAGDRIAVAATGAGIALDLADSAIDVLIDPYGLLFDSEDGSPVSDVEVTLIDVASDRPAAVFAPDGVTRWPSTVRSGQPVVDAAGNRYEIPPGEYRFPLAAPGRYRLQVAPASPYTAPSKATAGQLAGLARPDGEALTITDASYGGSFVLSSPEPVRIDVPLDRPAVALGLTKTASRGTAMPGDQIVYTLTVRNADPAHAKRDVGIVDAIPAMLRLRPDTIRVDGRADPAAVAVSADGRTLTVRAGTLAPNAARVVRYALEVRADARDGQAINRAVATDSRGNETLATAAVRISRRSIADRMTLLGRVTDGACSADAAPRGVPGVRVMLEDGSYAVTDGDGRYHFEGLVPGTHVAQADAATLPAGAALVDCTRSTRAAGSAGSRFVEGQGGALAVADFHVRRDPAAAAAVASATGDVPAAPEDRVASGADRDWFKDGSASIAWLFPEADHNPRSPAIRVAIRHLPGQTVALTANGKPVDPMALDGTRDDASKTFAVTLWRGLPLAGERTRFEAIVRNPDGGVAATLQREVGFNSVPARAELLPGRSVLVADGVRRPLLAVRLTDRNGRPVHHGVVGGMALSAPYEIAAVDDAEQARKLTGLERAAPGWRVTGDDGIAYIPLVATTTSGAVTLDFTFRDQEQARTQRLEAWLSPGQRDWTLVGLAEGRIGRHALGDHVEPLAQVGDGVAADGRIALYAKGRILGRWLLTAAYDSDKRRGDQPLGGLIDPDTYYTVYADRTERRYDAASTRKLYLRLESRQFYALFGDFVTGFDETELGRYVRAGTGVKGEFRGANVRAAGFAARFDTAHRRDEMQGSGLSAGYALSGRDIVANSERVVIEVRDRLRSERIVERRTLTRFLDYDIDYATGALRFKAPILSRSSALDPQFIVVDYERIDPGAGAVSAGGRASWRTGDDRVRVGATVLRDAGEATTATTIGALDARVRIGADSQLRAEVGVSAAGAGTDLAWVAEFEHHDRRFDVLAYARQQDRDYGVLQQNLAERGRRKVGVDGRIRLGDALSLSGSAWTDDDLDGSAQRRALRALVQYRTGSTDLRAGLIYAADHTLGGADAGSTLIEAGATRRFFGNRLELDAAANFALGGADSVDFPARQRLTARFQATPDIALVGAYEIADGDAVAARTARIGFDVKPWTGARLTSSFAGQDIAEYGRRAYAAYGLAQSLPIGPHWTVDVSLDGNRTLGGIRGADLVNPAQPVASGGYVGAGDTITEDFTAVTLGANFRAAGWSASGRAEYRAGEYGDRAGVALGLIKQLGGGSVLGGIATWTRAGRTGGVASETLDLALSGATRPDGRSYALLGKLAWREDRISDAVAGLAGPVGGAPLVVSGDAVARRIVGSASANWSPAGYDDAGRFQRAELQLFVGGRYVLDRIDAFDLSGFTSLIGVDARLGLGERLELAATGTIRGDFGRGVYGYAFGPAFGFRPATNMLVSIGYNVRGFADRDFAAERTTQQGPYVSARLKFDQSSLAAVGLGSRRPSAFTQP